MPEPWAAYFQAHYDALPSKIRAAVRDHHLNIDPAALRKRGRTEAGMMALLASADAPTLSSAYEAAVARRQKAA